MSRCLTTAPRSPRSAQLLRTTALLTLIPLLAAAQPAFADLIIDNANAPNSTGTTGAVSGTWSMGSEVWWDNQANAYVALGNGQTGVLSNPNGAVTLTLDGTIDIGGLVVDDDDFTLTGGRLTNSTGKLILGASSSGTRLTTYSALDGDVSVENGLELLHRGASTDVGTIEVDQTSALNNTGAITGAINNSGTFNLQRTGTVTGDVENSGSMVMWGDTTDQSKITGDVSNLGTLRMRVATIDGSVDNASGAVLSVDVTTEANITGDVQNDGEIHGVSNDTVLKVGGRLTNAGKIDVVGGNDHLTINADEILLTATSSVDFNDVTLNGTEVNQGQLTLDSNNQTLAGGRINGGLLNEEDGVVDVLRDLDGSDFEITNENEFNIGYVDRWTTRQADVTNVKKFTNRGTDAALTINDGSSLSADTVENSGTITNDGTLSGLDTVAAPITNLEFGVIDNNGTINGDIVNKDGATINNGDEINGDVDNENGGTLTSTGKIAGAVNNAGNATLSGEITGTLTNTANGSGTDDVFTLGGDLVVGGLDNSGKITIGQGDTLTNNGASATNSGTLDVDGDLTRGVINTGSLDVTGTVSGIIENNTGGKLTSTGTIGGLTNASAIAGNAVAGTVNGNALNRATGDLTSSATVNGNFDNNGKLSISGKVTGTLTNGTNTAADPSLTLAGNLEVGGLVNNDEITVANGTTLKSGSAVDNNDTLNVNGTLDGAVDNDGTLNVSGEVTKAITNNAAGKLTSTGTIGGLTNASAIAGNSVSGAVNGNVLNRATGDLTSSATVNGNFDNNGKLSISGKVTGTLTNGTNTAADPSLTLAGNLEVGGLVNNDEITVASGTTLKSGSAVDNNDTLNVSGKLDGAVDNDGALNVSGEVTGKVTNNDGGTLNSTGTLGALENDSANATVSGKITGNVENKDDGVLVSSATIGGNVINDGTATLSKSVAGTITNGGTLNVSGTLTTGANVDPDDPTVINSGTVNLTGALTGRVENNETMNMTGSTLTGSLVNNDQLNIGGLNTIYGDLTSTGTITGVSTDADLLVTDGTFFFDDGEINVTTGNKLTITADMIELGDDAVYDNANVTLIGGVANSGTMIINEDDTLEGALINRVGGQVTLSAAMDAAGFNVTNNGDFLVTTDSNSVGNLHGVNTLTNSGTFEIESGTTVSATTTTNAGGTMTVGGGLTTTLDNQQGATLTIDGGTVTGAVTNAGTVNGDGRIAGLLTNDGAVNVATGDTLTVTKGVKNTGSVEIGGELAAQISNTAAGDITLTGGKISGAVGNAGTISGNGTITGKLTNSGTADLGGTLGAVANSGTFGTNGNLTVASLTNNGTVNIDAGDRLGSTSAVQNNKQLNVAGTLTAALTNSAKATTTMQGGTLAGAVTNNGLLNGTGTITGTLTNNSRAAIAGAAGIVTNNGTLRSTGNLDINTLANTGTTIVTSNTTVTVDTPFANAGTLEVGGNLVADLTNQANASTKLTGGTITGNVENRGSLTGTGTIDGTLTNRSNIDVTAGNTLSTTSTSNYGTLAVSGTLGGTLINRAAGTTRLTGGTIAGAVGNLGTLTGNGTITGKLTNSNIATLGGVLASVENGGTLTAKGALSATSLNNTGTVAIGAADRLSVSGNAVNQAGGTVDLDGRFVGNLTNSGTISGNGAITGMLTSNGGKLDIDGSMTVGDLSNIGTLTLAAGDTLISNNQAENAGRLNLLGKLDSDLLNNGVVGLNGGTIAGDVVNAAGKTIFGTGTITGDLTNNGLARLAGSVGDVVNNNRLETAGKLTVASLSNAGTVTIEAGEELQSAAAVLNANQLSLAGMLTGSLSNANGGVTTLNGGTVTGDVLNQGSLTGRGAIKGTLTNRSATASIGGSIGDDLINLGGTLTNQGDLTVEGRILNSAETTLVLSQKSTTVNAAATPGLITIAKGTTVTAQGGAQNGPNATIQIDGTLVSDIWNNGTVVNDGTLTGNVSNLTSFTSNGKVNGSIVTGFYDGKYYDAASAELNGTVSGDVTYAAGTLKLKNGLTIGGTLDLHKSYTLADGQRVNAGRTLVQKDTTLSLGGTLGGNVVNGGTIKLTDNSAAIAGGLENLGTLDLRNGDAHTVLTTQGLSGNGVIMLDVFTGEDLGGDKVVVAGGATTGHVHLSFNELKTVGGATVGKATTLLDVDDGYNNDFSYSADELAASSERIVYSVEQTGNGDVQLISQVNPAIGAMFANVTLVQSLIGSVINRPTSPYVTGLVTDYADKPCGIGGWGRATGGTATVQGKTNNQVSTLENEVSASYYGMQGGADLVCFDDRYAGWDLSFGVLAGVNIGDSRQPIYAVDSRNSQTTTGKLASVTTTDFQQVYGGVYMTGTKDRWTADLQIRGEKTDFELKNNPVEGSGLLIETPEFSSDGITVSGSLAYSMPVKETGWVFTPNVGFAWSKFSTDSISFEGDFELEFDDSERQIGFVGASIGKTFIQDSENAAIHTFATATYFKDFADDAVSRLYNPTLEGYETQVLTSENLKNYGEVSVGANYVKVLNPGKSGRPRQFSTSARIDGRFGDSIDSVGVTGQFRLQF